MSLTLHTDLFDQGLGLLQSTSLTATLCQGAPTTRTEAAALLSGGGKRIGSEIAVAAGDITIADGAELNSRRASVAQQFGIVVESVDGASADLWIAIYDGSRLLIVTDAVPNTEKTAGDDLRLAPLEITFKQPVMV